MKKVISDISIEIDPQDWETICKIKKHRIFFVTKNGSKHYPMIFFDKKPYSLVRFILGITDKKIVVKHKDKNNLNLQRSNLETMTKRMANRAKTKTQKKRTSQYIGVSFCKRRNKWRSQIKVHKGSNVHIGYFSLEEEAAEAYNKLALIHFGKLAPINKI